MRNIYSCAPSPLVLRQVFWWGKTATFRHIFRISCKTLRNTSPYISKCIPRLNKEFLSLLFGDSEAANIFQQLSTLAWYSPSYMFTCRAQIKMHHTPPVQYILLLRCHIFRCCSAMFYFLWIASRVGGRHYLFIFYSGLPYTRAHTFLLGEFGFLKFLFNNFSVFFYSCTNSQET